MSEAGHVRMSPSPPRLRLLSVTESAVRSRPTLGSVMSKYQFTPSPELTSIERPRCSHCTSRMMLARISRGPMGFEHRLFQCPTCDFVQNEVVRSEEHTSE